MKTKSITIFYYIAILSFSLLFMAGCIQVQSPTNKIAQDPRVKQLNFEEYKINTVILNKKKREIYVPGSINMQTGLVEYLACNAEFGKLHESVLKINALPSDIQIALLLLGLKYKNNLQFQGDPTIPEGDHLELWVEWEAGEKTMKRVRAEELVFNNKTNKPMEKTYWAYTGSQIFEGKFIADVEGSIAAVFRDPAALINNPLPHGADDKRYFSNEKLVPPVDTKVIFIIKSVEDPKKINLLLSNTD